jgi:hypothetical protein
MDEMDRMDSMDTMDGRVGDWIQTYSGGRFWPLDPRAEEVEIIDIAHALSQICRYNGHCRMFYSVAQHSMLVAAACSAENRLWGLMHDAAEAYLADVVRPVKHCLEGWEAIEERVLRAIAERFGLAWPVPAEVKEIDTRILINEKRDLMRNPAKLRWGVEVAFEALELGPIEPMTSMEAARGLFVERFYGYWAEAMKGRN